MAKKVQKKVDSNSTSIKSKKPRMPGINSPKDCPKGFTTHECKGILSGVVGTNKFNVFHNTEST